MISESDFDSLKPGDKVKIIDAWLPKKDVSYALGPCNENINGKMDHWLGKIMTVKSRLGSSAHMEEDSEENWYEYGKPTGWYWNRYCIDKILGKETSIGLEELI